MIIIKSIINYLVDKLIMNFKSENRAKNMLSESKA